MVTFVLAVRSDPGVLTQADATAAAGYVSDITCALILFRKSTSP